MPLIRKLPKKRGFHPRRKKVFQWVNLDRIARKFPEGGSITPELLQEHRLIRSAEGPIKILGNGQVSVPYYIVADAFSKQAEQKILQAGGSIQLRSIWKKGE